MPVVTPALLNFDSRTLGPVQTLYESLNRFISLGGNDHTNRRQTCSAVKSESRADARMQLEYESESGGRNNSF